MQLCLALAKWKYYSICIIWEFCARSAVNLGRNYDACHNPIQLSPASVSLPVIQSAPGTPSLPLSGQSKDIQKNCTLLKRFSRKRKRQNLLAWDPKPFLLWENPGQLSSGAPVCTLGMAVPWQTTCSPSKHCVLQVSLLVISRRPYPPPPSSGPISTPENLSLPYERCPHSLLPTPLLWHTSCSYSTTNCL